MKLSFNPQITYNKDIDKFYDYVSSLTSMFSKHNHLQYSYNVLITFNKLYPPQIQNCKTIIYSELL